MSGQGGGSWTPVPGNSCATLTQTTTLNSPKRAVLSRIRKGDLLEIRINKAGPAPIVEALHNADVAGTITSSIIQQIAECVEQGYEYVAEVLEVQGGACRVQVKPK